MPSGPAVMGPVHLEAQDKVLKTLLDKIAKLEAAQATANQRPFGQPG